MLVNCSKTHSIIVDTKDFSFHCKSSAHYLIWARCTFYL